MRPHNLPPVQMVSHNGPIDLKKVYLERVKPELSSQESAAMERAIAAPPLRTLFTYVADKVHWYILDAPVTCAERYGEANSRSEAEERIAQLLGMDQKNRVVFT